MTTSLELATQTAEMRSPAPPGPATVRLPYVAQSAATARHLVRAKLTEWELPDLIDGALLIISELVANAVGTGCQTYMIVAIRRPTDHTVRLLVSDGSASLPVRIDAGSDAESGRGLDLVHKLTKGKWGVQLWHRGKVVHADLPTPVPDHAPSDHQRGGTSRATAAARHLFPTASTSSRKTK